MTTKQLAQTDRRAKGSAAPADGGAVTWRRRNCASLCVRGCRTKRLQPGRENDNARCANVGLTSQGARMKRSSSGAVALLAFLIGCATGPTYENYTGQDAACVDGDTAASFTRYWTEGEAHVFILEIDGVRKKPREPVCLPPGNHDLKIRTAAANAIQDHYLDFHFQTGNTCFGRTIEKMPLSSKLWISRLHPAPKLERSGHRLKPPVRRSSLP